LVIDKNNKSFDAGLEAFLHLIDPNLELPQVSVAPVNINLRLERGKTHEEYIYITNEGRGILSCTLELSKNIDGVTFNPFIINTGYGYSKATVSTLRIETTRLASGRTYRTSIIISSNGDRPVIEIPLTILVEERQRRMRVASNSALKVALALALPFNLFAIDRMCIYYGHYTPLTNPWDPIIFVLMGLFLGLLPAVLLSGGRPRWYTWILFFLSVGTVAAGVTIAQLNDQVAARMAILAYALVVALVLILSIIIIRLCFYYYPRNSLFLVVLITLSVFAMAGFNLNNLACQGPVIVDPDEGSIYLAENGGSNLLKLGPGRRPYLSSGGSHVAYSRRSEGGPSYLYTGNIYKEESMQLAIDYAWLDWSPDEEQLAFVERARHYFDSAKVVVVNKDGSRAKQIRPPAEIEPDRSRYGSQGWLISSPQWSPDGSKLAYYCQGETPQDWYVVVYCFLANEQSMVGPVRNLPFRWKPDQSAITYINYANKLVLFNIENGQETILAEESSNSFKWSPDGNYVAYSSLYGRELYIVDSSGDDRKSVSSKAGEFQWSPDNKQLAYVTSPEDSDQRYLNVVNYDGSGNQRLGYGENPLWSPDATFIAFTSGNSSYIMDSTGGEPYALAEICEPGDRPDSRQDYYWWSPGSDKIAYLAWDYQPYKLFFLNVHSEDVTYIGNRITYMSWIPHTGDKLVHQY